MQSPVVTTIIPCHNHVKWVAGAIESIEKQDYPSSIVVIDDGSTDGSLAAALSAIVVSAEGTVEGMVETPKVFKGKTTYGIDVVIIRFESGHGPSFSRNRGIEIATAVFNPDIFAFLDSDDVYSTDKISKSVAKFAANPDVVGAVYSDYDSQRPDGLKLREFKEPFSRKRLLEECIVNMDSLVSAIAIRAVGGFDEEMRVVEDYDLWLRISEKYLIVHIPEALVTIRTGSHSSTSTVANEVWQKNWQRVMQKVIARRGK